MSIQSAEAVAHGTQQKDSPGHCDLLRDRSRATCTPSGKTTITGQRGGTSPQGKHKEGLDELQKAASLSGGSPLYTAQVGVSLTLAGEKKEALRVIRELRDISATRYVSPYGIAQIYAALHDKEQSYKWLETAYRDRAVWMSYLAVDPVFDSIRSEARFQDLLHRVGLD